MDLYDYHEARDSLLREANEKLEQIDTKIWQAIRSSTPEQMPSKNYVKAVHKRMKGYHSNGGRLSEREAVGVKQLLAWFVLTTGVSLDEGST